MFETLLRSVFHQNDFGKKNILFQGVKIVRISCASEVQQKLLNRKYSRNY